MLNKEKHQLIMGQILRDIYSDTSISPLIGFKGGTCAYLFYGLKRFSVDLDFDLFLIEEATQKLVHKKIHDILRKYGDIKDDYIIKIEANMRIFVPDIKEHYEVKEYLGISMLVGSKDYLFASKLAALTNRRLLAMRDIYDIWFFGTNHWDINAEVLKE